MICIMDHGLAEVRCKRRQIEAALLVDPLAFAIRWDRHAGLALTEALRLQLPARRLSKIGGGHPELLPVGARVADRRLVARVQDRLGHGGTSDRMFPLSRRRPRWSTS